MHLNSPAFSYDQPVPEKYTCKGPNISPPLEFHEVPAEAESLVLVVEDIDSPDQWVHWLAYNIPPDTRRLEEGRLPEGAVDGVCNGGTHGYEGPCPKYFTGLHHYRFSLYALDTVLDLPYSADTAEVRRRMDRHVIDTHVLIGTAEGEEGNYAEHRDEIPGEKVGHRAP